MYRSTAFDARSPAAIFARATFGDIFFGMGFGGVTQEDLDAHTARAARARVDLGKKRLVGLEHALGASWQRSLGAARHTANVDVEAYIEVHEATVTWRRAPGKRSRRRGRDADGEVSSHRGRAVGARPPIAWVPNARSTPMARRG